MTRTDQHDTPDTPEKSCQIARQAIAPRTLSKAQGWPVKGGEYGLLWIRRMPSTAQVRASHAFANGAPLSA